MNKCVYACVCRYTYMTNKYLIGTCRVCFLFTLLLSVVFLSVAPYVYWIVYIIILIITIHFCVLFLSLLLFRTLIATTNVLNKIYIHLQ